MARRVGIARVFVAAVALAVVAFYGAGCSGGANTAGSSSTTAASTGATATTSATDTASSTTTVPDPIGAELAALLTPEDVQQVSGLTDVRRAGRNPERRLGGDLNFVTSAGDPLLMVVLEPGDAYEAWKADPDSFREEINGVGEVAFIGPTVAMNEAPYLLVFRSGERAIGLFTYDDPASDGWVNLLSMDQLQALARVVIGRL